MLIDNILAKMPPSPSEKVYFYILSHTDGNTKVFSRTYAEIKADTGASEPTIAKVFKVLKQRGLLVPLGKSRWQNNIVAGYSDTCDGDGIYIRAHH